MIEAAIGRHAFVERRFACMTEWRMAKIVRQGKRFGQIFIEPQNARKRAGDLRDF